MKRISTLLALLICLATTISVQAQQQTLFEFGEPNAARQWQTVNDGVMGGRSDGRFKINSSGNMEFFGNLSLENNGGFASVRARGNQIRLGKGDVITARVRGDGREYKFNVYAGRTMGGISFRQSFQTKKNEWIEVQFPIDRFVASWRGRSYADQKLDPAKITGVGFLLGDKKPGPFKLEVEWVKGGPAERKIQ
ncbi:CIA30 family protein [Rubripirellula sp.]|jgi:monofunctional biosynthetic peptidoglycan transglycosylase|nr:CIA30 family protein [Rubripirellula sp.]